MKKIFILGLFLCPFLIISAQIPTSDDLRESGVSSRRDLSIQGSRLVINPYDFKKDARIQPSHYNDRPNIPLNVAYLNIHNALKAEENRYGREYKDVLTIYRKTERGMEEAAGFKTEWLPYALPFSAAYTGGKTVSGYDLFYDDNTILRSLALDDTQRYIVAGRIKGKVSIKKNVIFVSGANSNYAISLKGISLKNVSLYESFEDFKAGNIIKDTAKAGWWSIDVSRKKQLTVSVAFSLVSDPQADLIKWVQSPLKVKDVCNRTLMKNKKYWDNFLKDKVPHPENFDLVCVDAKGVTSKDIKLGYYKAWVLLEQNCLKPEPEYFNYYQMVTGKASLWDEGEAKAPFSASWESFVALQLYSYINPDISWSALNGIVSLINDKGILEGESLPSRKAHSAWVLYSMTKDTESLKKVYTPIKKYLNWRMTQPRWIYADATPENEKDAEFVVSVMVDMEYMEQIANALGYKEDAKEWKEKYTSYYDNYTDWFWSAPDEMPMQFKNNFKHRTGYPIQITQGLVLDRLNGDYLTGLMGVLYKYYDVNKSFAGFSAPKYPDVDFTIYGLIKKNKPNLVRGLIECNIRDIMRTGPFFAESYTSDPTPLPEGVRPSIFGIASLIDFVLLKNGYMFTKGVPHAVNLFDQDGGVIGINYMGEKFNVSLRNGVVNVNGLSNMEYKNIKVNRNEMVPLF